MTNCIQAAQLWENTTANISVDFLYKSMKKEFIMIDRQVYV